MNLYKNETSYRHDQAPRIGVLITNLGTPAAPTAKAVRPYLREFLSDTRVVEIPRLIWWFILNGVVLLTRPPRSAHAYAKIWTEQGSPLLVNTQKQAAAIAEQLGESYVVAYAMRYGQPSIAAGLQQLKMANARHIIVLPLYPQYAASSTGSTFDAVAKELTQWRWVPELRFVGSYHDHENYINVLAASVKQHWQQHGRAEKLVMSFHGLPKAHLLQGDPYFCQCHKTGRLLAERLQLSSEQYQITFQSRFGAQEWLQPYTDVTLKQLPTQGVKNIDVICPGFSSDCLETLEEIMIQNQELFKAAGGEQFKYIPALNAEPAHIEMLTQLIKQQTQGWQLSQEGSINIKVRAQQQGAQQ
ncbi:MAG: ferrochelatase [Gammaproteobacteria bacterium]|nr:ferrochelatase [Gammaproteobacteria bacterium]